LNERSKIEAVEKALGSPIGAELPENAIKVRRNLLISSMVALFVAFGGLKLDPASSILGFKFVGLTDDLIRIGLAAVTLYLLLHFLWYVYDALLEWRLRVTGTRLSFVTTARMASEHGDYPNDPRQSTLYHWWSEEAKRMGNVGARALAVDDKLRESQQAVRALLEEKGSGSNLQNILNVLTEMRNALTELNRSVEHIRKTLDSDRISVSLKRFDGWFELFLRSQNLRWLIVDAVVPSLLGTWALVVLVCQL
jgi:hypothetical protein